MEERIDLDKLVFFSRDELADTYLKELFDLAVSEDARDTFFYSHKKITFEEFVELVNEKYNNLIVAEYNGVPATFIIVKEVLPMVGSVSYYCFNWIRGKYTVDVGIASLYFMINHYNTLIGISPKTKNNVSSNFNRKIGMEEVGTIDNACYVEGTGIVDGSLLQFTRGKVKPW